MSSWVVSLVVLAALFALAAVLYTVHRTKPESFKLSAKATKWFSFDVEMRSSRPDTPAVEDVVPSPRTPDQVTDESSPRT